MSTAIASFTSRPSVFAENKTFFGSFQRQNSTSNLIAGMSLQELMQLEHVTSTIQGRFRTFVAQRERNGCIISSKSVFKPIHARESMLMRPDVHIRVSKWLEGIDVKHRHGPTLRLYHIFWLRNESADPFFVWLDQGKGSQLDLKFLKRLTLEQRQITYCTPRGREQYRVDEDLVQNNYLCLRERFTGIPLQNGTMGDDDVGAGGEWIFVLGSDNHLYVTYCLNQGRFHHQSFFGKEEINAAGTLILNDGIVKQVELIPVFMSKNGWDQKVTLSHHWQTLGVDLRSIKFDRVTSDSKTYFYQQKKASTIHQQTPIITILSQSHVPLLVTRIQKRFRAYKVRREKNGMILDCSSPFRPQVAQWNDTLRCTISRVKSLEVEKYQCTESASSKKLSLKRVKTYIKSLTEGLSDSDSARMLHAESWLEAVDKLHRYGASLRKFHEAWLKRDTSHPFFYWLDKGDGVRYDHEECSRLDLESMCVQYCDSFARKNFEVDIEHDAVLHQLRIRYSLSKIPVDTTLDGDKWIFVLSPSGVLYVNKKTKGRFHHSSFLSGRPTLAAGKLQTTGSEGILVNIEPHSGHYKPSLANLKEFWALLAESAGESGLDLHQCKTMKTVHFKKPKKWKEDWTFA